jgi:hypothetical protein
MSNEEKIRRSMETHPDLLDKPTGLERGGVGVRLSIGVAHNNHNRTIGLYFLFLTAMVVIQG